ncbi:uncharacterized mitochondrial protein AtMg00310-like [Mercurialis annua]|uniref:uncharacterized mitochondrial protein AtMg00310-like n=1 Tax=Mercurialis annua TaxID=3986 RepID=UPI00215F2E68|nr:uncharacterized mitochondrial protein AtMg00310-like [Mercurialis annua]
MERKKMSQVGKDVMLKAAISAILVYAMMCFHIPLALYKKINSLMSRFWWGKTKEKRKISWISWTCMCKSKGDGGLGFRDFTSLNQSLLAKKAWIIAGNLTFLLFRLLKGRYFNSTHILKAKRGLNLSRGW